MYNNDTVYGNSAVVYRLKKYYGVHFLHLFRPWDFSFTAKVYTNEMPCVLTSHKSLFILNVLKLMLLIMLLGLLICG